MQLSLFDDVEKKKKSNSIAKTKINVSEQRLLKWDMYKWFDEHEGKIFSLNYMDTHSTYSIPFCLGQMQFSTNILSSPNPELYSFKNGTAQTLSLSGGKLRELVINKEDINFYYDKKYYVGNKSQIEQHKKSKVTAREFNQYKRPSKEKNNHIQMMDKDLSPNDILKKLTDVTVYFKIRFCDELFYQVQTEPIVLRSAQIDGNEIRLEGSNDLRIHMKGFKNIRVMSDSLLFDVCHPDNGMKPSFYMYFMY